MSMPGLLPVQPQRLVRLGRGFTAPILVDYHKIQHFGKRFGSGSAHGTTVEPTGKTDHHSEAYISSTARP